MNLNSSQSVKSVPGERTLLLAVGRGILVSYLTTIPTFMLLSLVLTYTDFPEKFISPAVFITTLLSILIAGITSTKRVRNKGWLYGGMVGFLYMLMLYLASSLVFKDFSLDRHVFSMTATSIFVGAVGGIIGINMKKESKARTYR